MADYGKKFEEKFMEDWLRTTSPTCERLHDQVTGYKITSQNPCDFITFGNGKFFYVEVKSHAGNTFPFSAFPQYDRMVEKAGREGVRVGVVLWLYDHEDCIVYVPITTFMQLKAEGKKSFHFNMIDDDNYPCIRIPSTKKRVYYDSNYSVLLDTEDGW